MNHSFENKLSLKHVETDKKPSLKYKQIKDKIQTRGVRTPPLEIVYFGHFRIFWGNSGRF